MPTVFHLNTSFRLRVMSHRALLSAVSPTMRTRHIVRCDVSVHQHYPLQSINTLSVTPPDYKVVKSHKND